MDDVTPFDVGNRTVTPLHSAKRPGHFGGLSFKALVLLFASLAFHVTGVHAEDVGEGGDCCGFFAAINRTQSPSVQRKSKALYDDLMSKSLRELTLLRLSDNVCTQVDCRGIPAQIGARYVEAAMAEKQIEYNQKISETGVRAAEISSRIAIVSAIIAFLSLVVSVAFGFLSHRRKNVQ